MAALRTVTITVYSAFDGLTVRYYAVGNGRTVEVKQGTTLADVLAILCGGL